MEKLTIPHHDMYQTSTSMPPESYGPVYSEGEDHRVENHDTDPHQAEICQREVQSLAPGTIGGSHTKPPRRDGQPVNCGKIFHTHSSFDKEPIHPSEVGGTKGGGWDFPWVIAH